MPKSLVRFRASATCAVLGLALGGCGFVPGASEPTSLASPTVGLTATPVRVGIGELASTPLYFVEVVALEDPWPAPAGYELRNGDRLVRLEVIVGNRSETESVPVPDDPVLIDAAGDRHARISDEDVSLLVSNRGVRVLFAGERTRYAPVFEVGADTRLDHLTVGLGGDTAWIDLTDAAESRTPDALPPYHGADVPALGSRLEANGFSLTAQQVQESPKTQNDYTAPRGYRLVEVVATLGVVAGPEIQPYAYHSSLVTADGFVYSSTDFAWLINTRAFYDALKPGEERTGNFGFLLPEGAVPEYFRYEAGPIDMEQGRGTFLTVGLEP